MRNPERVPLLTQQFQNLWKEMPDMRFGQMMTMLWRDAGAIHGDPFYMEDSEWQKVIGRRLVEEESQKVCNALVGTNFDFAEQAAEKIGVQLESEHKRIINGTLFKCPCCGYWDVVSKQWFSANQRRYICGDCFLEDSSQELGSVAKG